MFQKVQLIKLNNFNLGVRYGKKLLSTLSTLTTESSHIYFLWVKTNLTGSKGHISVRIDQKWAKWRHFGHKMTSYVEIGVRYDKKFFSTSSTLTTESSHIYFFGVEMELKGSKS